MICKINLIYFKSLKLNKHRSDRLLSDKRWLVMHPMTLS